MRKFMLLGALTGLLVGCANMAAIDHAVNTPVAASTAIDEKALYTAEASYNFIATTYVDVVNRKLISGATKAVVKPKVQQAYQALKAARAAYAVGDAATFGEKYRTILALKGEVCTLTGKVCT